jgi:hypothetical protein
MRTFTIIMALVVSVWVAFEKDCLADDSDTGFSFDINLGVAVYNTDEEAKPELDCEVKPAVLAKLQYTFDGGNQIYIGTILENGGEPSVGATFGHGLVDVSAFYITPVEVYKDPYLTEREKTTQAGLGGKLALNIKSFKAIYEVRYTEVKDDEIGKRFKELSRDEFTQTLSAAYEIDVYGLFLVEPNIDVTFAMNNAKENGDEWAQSYNGAKIGLSLTKMLGSVVVNASAKGGENRYANDDPIFNAERVDEVVNMTGAVTWLAPFGYEKYSAMVVGGVNSVDSSIELYDKDEVYGLMTVGYHF